MTEQQRHAEAGHFAPPARATRLAQFLIGKSIAEALFIAALAVVFTHQSFNPYFRGSVDVADAERVGGWVVDESTPGARVEVQLYINDHFVGQRTADEYRPDVSAAGRAADEYHGFAFATPPLPRGNYEARVYAAHPSGNGARRTLQMIGRPLSFNVEHERQPKAPDVWWQE